MLHLRCETPRAWLDHALAHLDEVLVDHAHCEKKAASTALSLCFRYPDRPELSLALSALAFTAPASDPGELQQLLRTGYLSNRGQDE